MRFLDLSSWQGVLVTIAALALITLIGVGIRLLLMQTVQQRRQRENRQINERLRTLIAAYKVLGGSFTGTLEVDPTHLRELRARARVAGAGEGDEDGAATAESGSDRSRRIRDAVEAALSDILLLGTEEQVRLAARAAEDLAAGRRVQTAELVVSLRGFIRQVLDLEEIPADVRIPPQGPTRPGSGGGGREGSNRRGSGNGDGGAGGGGMGGGAAAGGAALGLGGAAHSSEILP